MSNKTHPMSLPLSVTDTSRYGSLWVDVVGESFREDVNRSLFPGSTGFVELNGQLIREPNNPHSKTGTSIGVWINGAGQVGYVSHEDSIRYASIVDSYGGTMNCGIRLARNAPEHFWSVTVVTDARIFEPSRK